MPLTAPFPYFGGKRRIAPEVWRRFGDPDLYIEPFAGSLAVLLNRDMPCLSEVVSDRNGYISNFWRSTQRDPELVAYWADYPTFHQDLTARQRSLWEWREANIQRLIEDTDYYDAQYAGWWVWGVSNWIGSNYAEPTDMLGRRFSDRIPRISPSGSGAGVSMQRKRFGSTTPHSNPRAKSKSARSVRIWQRDALTEYFQKLAYRLKDVAVFNWDWSRVTASSLPENTVPVSRDCAIFLDPPYRMRDRSRGIYVSDLDDSSEDVAVQSYKWACDHGEIFKVAYCCLTTDFPTPNGWDEIVMNLTGYSKKRTKVEKIMFSPMCFHPDPNDDLLGLDPE